MSKPLQSEDLAKNVRRTNANRCPSEINWGLKLRRRPIAIGLATLFSLPQAARAQTKLDHNSGAASNGTGSPWQPTSTQCVVPKKAARRATSLIFRYIEAR